MLTLKRIVVRGFKAVDGLLLSLEPGLTVLLGMNGAGKSSILQVFALARYLAEGKPSRFFEERGWDRKVLRFKSPNNRSSIVRISARFESERWGQFRWTIRWGLNTGRLQTENVQLWRTPTSEPVNILNFDHKTGGRAGEQDLPALRFEGSVLSALQGGGYGTEVDGIVTDLFVWLTTIQSLELLSPVAMKGGTRLSKGEMGPRGERLAGFIAGLRPDQRSRIASRVGLFYPLGELDTIRKRAGWIDLMLAERFQSLSAIEAAQMSDGFMRMLALCSIPELPEVSLVLLDEIEDGIEPHILGRLIAMLSAETRAQIIATTHSPVLANVVGTSALRLISRTPEGKTVAAAVDRLPAFQIGSEYLGAGELWTNTELAVLERQAQQVAGGEAAGPAEVSEH